jgi:hypothetical protein
MTDHEKLELARTELLQASVELEEAAKIIAGRNLPQVSNLFAIAANRKREVAALLYPALVDSMSVKERFRIATGESI